MVDRRPVSLVLRRACTDDGIEVWSMIREMGPGENGFHNDGYDVPFSRFRDFLKRLVDMERGAGLREGFVPQTTFWAFAGTRAVGISKLRHELTDSLRRTGGNIGYAIRPSERGRGYGTSMLALTLVEAWNLGLDRVLITVNEDNRASWRIVERNYGTLVRREHGMRYYEVTAT